MKNLNITFENADFKKLVEARKKYPECKSWEEYILKLIVGLNNGKN
jgi:hypothetical protein